jgi:hypothetical protein
MALSPSLENPVDLSRQGQLGGRGTLLVDAFLCARNVACFIDSGASKSFVLLIAVAMGLLLSKDPTLRVRWQLVTC